MEEVILWALSNHLYFLVWAKKRMKMAIASSGSTNPIIWIIWIILSSLFSGRFKIQRQKESTGRVVFWNMGITCSYTMEASYGGTNMGSRAFTHFNTDDYEGIGRYAIYIYISLLTIWGFVLDEKFQRNASKFAILLT